MGNRKMKRKGFSLCFMVIHKADLKKGLQDHLVGRIYRLVRVYLDRIFRTYRQIDSSLVGSYLPIDSKFIGLDLQTDSSLSLTRWPAGQSLVGSYLWLDSSLVGPCPWIGSCLGDDYKSP